MGQNIYIPFAFSGLCGWETDSYFIAHTNDELFVFKIVDSPHWSFCKKWSGIPIDLLRSSGYVLERSFIVDNPSVAVIKFTFREEKVTKLLPKNIANY